MIALLRQLLVLAGLLLLGGGYVGSQLAANNGRHAEFALQMDQMPVRLLACLLLCGAIILGLLPDSPQEQEGVDS